MNKDVRKDTNNFDYFFVSPGKNANVHQTARKLIGIEKVNEVLITEGEFGFIVKTDLLDEKEMAEIDRKIANAASGSSRKATCYCQLNK